jgi:hypothetical protein
MILLRKTTLTHHSFQGVMILLIKLSIPRFSYIAILIKTKSNEKTLTLSFYAWLEPCRFITNSHFRGQF